MRFNREQWAWMGYDWANSGYGIIVTTAVMPLYFRAVASAAGVNGALSTAYWGYANSFGSLIVAVCAPFIGALADYANAKRPLMGAFTWLGIVTTAGLAICPNWESLLVCYILTSIGYSAAGVIYDAFLIDAAASPGGDPDQDRLSATGYGVGYLGGVVAFAIFLVLDLTSGFGVLDSTGVARAGFLLAAIWWLLFYLPFARLGTQRYHRPGGRHHLHQATQRVLKTGKTLCATPALRWFLLAYFCYNDGVSTIYTMATSIGAGMGLSTANLLAVLMVVQLIAVPFSVLFGHLANRFGRWRVLTFGVVAYTAISLYAIFLKTALDFWILAGLVGMVQGGVQALSRSYFAQLLPRESDATEYFGFYNILGRFSAIIGPFIVGLGTQLTGKATIGAGGLAILFLLGLFFLAKVGEPPQSDR